MQKLRQWYRLRMVSLGASLLAKHLPGGRTVVQLYPILSMLNQKLAVGLELGVMAEKDDDEYVELLEMQHSMLGEPEETVRMLN